jgi:hypothetical protein
MGMGGGSSGSQSSTTKTGPPSWLVPYAKLFLGEQMSQIFPGMNLPNIPGLGIQGGQGGSGYPQIAPYNTALNQNVAGFSQDQQNAMAQGEAQTGQAQSLADQGASTQQLYASGGMLGPNPYLNQYYNQAAQQVGNQYEYATNPALMAQAQQAGAFNSSGFNEQQGLNEYGLGQSLATLGANIYEPAYQQESSNMLNAAQNAGQGIANLYAPSQNLYNIGAAQQQQQQNVNNAATQNAQQAANWPFNLLSQFGAGLGQAGMGGGTTVTTGPAGGGGK